MEVEEEDQFRQLLDDVSNGVVPHGESDSNESESDGWESDSDESDSDDSDSDEDEDEEEGGEDVAEIAPAMTSPRIPTGGPPTTSEEGVIDKGGEDISVNCKKGSEEAASGGREWNRSEVDAVFHVVIFMGWLVSRDGFSNTEVQGRKCTLKDVRVLYASGLVVVDEELQKRARLLEAKCASLEQKNDYCSRKEVDWQRREADLRLQVDQLTERTCYLEGLLEDKQRRSFGLFTANGSCQGQAILGHNLDSDFGKPGPLTNFVLQNELHVDGARYVDVDASSQIVIIARRLSGMAGRHLLTKVSLIDPLEKENIELPLSTKAVRDLRASPHSRLALVATLGKKLSVVSTDSNNTILSYDLPAAAWSCSWDISSLHYVYTGLQNGMVLAFDMRQTRRPVESVAGLTCNPIHTLHSLSPDPTVPSGVRTILSASSVGLCEWNFGVSEQRPYLVPESENQGVCISLACCPKSDDIVASFRPKVEMSGEMTLSQSFPTPSTSLTGHGVQGSHVLYKRLDGRCYQKLGSTCANVDDLRLPKSAILDHGNHNLLFASADDARRELVLQELPSLRAVQHLTSPSHPIRDVKYTHVGEKKLLSCLSDDMLQLFSLKSS
ncbi:hypothetical protein RJ639_032139 [Escallonia herrerae]|uniref:RING-type E3 ubiquitin transferase n=1 Tax=Escallonia herrerae TaxID=1293975 RepID=A0AA88X689_9ASTE|nr:hypothetical protein RJ639_032139 [Escallonia herrerae]